MYISYPEDLPAGYSIAICDAKEIHFCAGKYIFGIQNLLSPIGIQAMEPANPLSVVIRYIPELKHQLFASELCFLIIRNPCSCL